jgi:hypothetical protein
MQSLQPGRTVVVTRMSSAQMEGKLLAITAESISVTWHGQPQVVPREDVYRVRMANIRRQHTLIGMAIGAAAGAVIGGVAMATDKSKIGPNSIGLAALLFGGIGAGIGAGVGGVLPIGPPLYQVAGPPRRAAGPAAQK